MANETNERDDFAQLSPKLKTALRQLASYDPPFHHVEMRQDWGETHLYRCQFCQADWYLYKMDGHPRERGEGHAEDCPIMVIRGVV